MQETQVRSLSGEDPLEKEMATHSSTLAYKIPWMEEPGGLESTGSQSQTRLSDFTFITNYNKIQHDRILDIFMQTAIYYKYFFPKW